MPRESKTKQELEALIMEQSRGLEIHSLEVRSDPIYGWAPFVVAHPDKVGDYQAHANRVARALRARFDLKS